MISENGKSFRTAMSLPGSLPCGCRLKNRQGGNIAQDAIMLKDGTRICKCGKRWGFVLKVKQYEEVGLYANRKDIRLASKVARTTVDEG